MFLQKQRVTEQDFRRFLTDLSRSMTWALL